MLIAEDKKTFVVVNQYNPLGIKSVLKHALGAIVASQHVKVEKGKGP
jgi:hypothetical protein